MKRNSKSGQRKDKPRPGNRPVDFSEINPEDYDEQIRPFDDVVRKLAPVAKPEEKRK